MEYVWQMPADPLTLMGEGGYAKNKRAIWDAHWYLISEMRSLRRIDVYLICPDADVDFWRKMTCKQRKEFLKPLHSLKKFRRVSVVLIPRKWRMDLEDPLVTKLPCDFER